MKKSKYLKWIAGFELLSFLIGLVAYVIYMFKTINALRGASGNGWVIFLLILGLIAILFFGPATFVLFNSVGDLLEIHQRELAHYEIEKEKARNNFSNSEFSEGQTVVITDDLKLPDGRTIPANSFARISQVLSDLYVVVRAKPDSFDEEVFTKVKTNHIKHVNKTN